MQPSIDSSVCQKHLEALRNATESVLWESGLPRELEDGSYRNARSEMLWHGPAPMSSPAEELIPDGIVRKQDHTIDAKHANLLCGQE